jgi:hypothetical protein
MHINLYIYLVYLWELDHPLRQLPQGGDEVLIACLSRLVSELVLSISARVLAVIR